MWKRGLLLLCLGLWTGCSGGGSASVDPEKQVERFEAAWAEFHRYVAAVHPSVDFKLRPGASDEDIAALEKAWGGKLTPELKALYRAADGQDGEGFALFPGYRFLPLEEITPQAELMNGAGLFFIRFIPADPDPGVKGWWWDNDWLPIGENGAGDLFCADFAPAKGGVDGQLIGFIHDASPRKRYADGPADLFEKLRAGLETGDWVAYSEWQVFLSREEADEYGIEAESVSSEPESPETESSMTERTEEGGSPEDSEDPGSEDPEEPADQ